MSAAAPPSSGGLAFNGDFVHDLGSVVPILTRFAVSLIGAAGADDLVQESLTNAWAKRHQYDPLRGTFLAWMLGIVKNNARRAWRLPRPLSMIALDVPSSPTGRSELSLDLRQAVKNLPKSQRVVVILFHYIDLPIADIAHILGRKPRTITSQLHHARLNLARQLGGNYAND